MGENHCTPKQHGSWNFWGVVETLMAQTVKNLPAMRETQVWALGWEDPLEWLPTPLFLPGEFHDQRSLAGYSLWGCKESDMTEWLTEKIYKTQKASFFFFSRKKQENTANMQRSSTKTMWLLEKLSPVLPDFPVFICRVDTHPSKRDSCHEPFKAPGLHRSQTHEKSLCPRDFPGKNTKLGSHFLLQVIFPTQGSNQGLCIAGRFFTIWATREAP